LSGVVQRRLATLEKRRTARQRQRSDGQEEKVSKEAMILLTPFFNILERIEK
jgi:hypothetical protein